MMNKNNSKNKKNGCIEKYLNAEFGSLKRKYADLKLKGPFPYILNKPFREGSNYVFQATSLPEGKGHIIADGKNPDEFKAKFKLLVKIRTFVTDRKKLLKAKPEKVEPLPVKALLDQDDYLEIVSKTEVISSISDETEEIEPNPEDLIPEEINNEFSAASHEIISLD